MNRNTANVVYYVLAIAAIIVMLISWMTLRRGDLETGSMLRSVAIGLLIAAIIFRVGQRLFPNWFRDRPTREEMDEKEN